MLLRAVALCLFNDSKMLVKVYLNKEYFEHYYISFFAARHAMALFYKLKESRNDNWDWCIWIIENNVFFQKLFIKKLPDILRKI